MPDGLSPAVPTRSTGSPTVMIGFCSLRRTNSSSSSHLCKLWKTDVCAGQTGYPPVVWLWRTGGTTGPAIHRPPDPPGCPPSSTGYPPVIHRLSPQSCGRAGPPGSPLSPEPSTGNPQDPSDPWTTAALSPAVHSLVPRVCPQPVGNWRRTERSFPPSVENRLWTTSGGCGRTRPDPAASTRWRVNTDGSEPPVDSGPSGGMCPGSPDPNARTPCRGPAGRRGSRAARRGGGRTAQVVCLIRLVSSAIWL